MSKAKLLLQKIHLIKEDRPPFQQRMIIFMVALGGILIIAFVIYLGFFTYFQKSIAHYLPADKTVAFAEVENMYLPLKLESKNEFSTANIENGIKDLFNIDLKSVVKDWTAGRVGIALIENKGEANTPVFFLHTNNRRKTAKYFESLLMPGEELVKNGTLTLPIYSYPQGQTFSFGFVGPYLIVSNSLPALTAVQESFAKPELTLAENKNYLKSIGNLPRTSWLRGYIDYQALDFKNNLAVNSVIQPLKNVINHFAFTVKQNPNGFHFNTFVNLKPELLSLRQENRDKTRFAYQLTDYISSKDLTLYIGGANLSNEWENTLETISNLNPAYGIILESVVRAQVNKVFGSEVDLRNDFYPLFEGEYAFSMAVGDDGNTNLSLLLSHDDREFVETKLKKMMNGFKYLAAQFAPKLRVVTLPDGTESRELVADVTSLEETSEKYEGYSVHCLEVKGTSYGFCYTVTDNLMAMANNLDTVKTTVDLSLSPKNALSQYQPFRQAIGNLSKVSDEITFIDIQKLSKLISGQLIGQISEPYLNAFDATAWVKHYFDDGASTEGYILIK